MSIAFEVLQTEVLHLPPSDRAKLLDRLIASLDVDAEAEAAWDALAEKREQGLGARVAVSADVAIARLEARFPG
ncbi:MAG: addiction module protein [Burkholderiaceae bacterium]|jgi:hypothetical protein|nr:addiction module protein [Burkholderiaceae bacterium]